MQELRLNVCATNLTKHFKQWILRIKLYCHYFNSQMCPYFEKCIFVHALFEQTLCMLKHECEDPDSSYIRLNEESVNFG